MSKSQTNWFFGGVSSCDIPRVWVYDNWCNFDLSRALSEVSPERREQALNLRFEHDRRLSVAVYLLLKEALEMEYGLKENPRFAYGLNGKPYLLDHPEIHFNLSHCSKAAVCALADSPVGVDVEVVAPVDAAVAQHVLSPAELKAVRDSNEPAVAFACYWTQKEALVKLTGEGIDDSALPMLLATASDIRFDTSINRERGYVLTRAYVSPLADKQGL